jgi:hypothetical protein
MRTAAPRRHFTHQLFSGYVEGPAGESTFGQEVVENTKKINIELLNWIPKDA